MSQEDVNVNPEDVEILAELVAFVGELADGDDSVLDEAVIDAKCGEASDINNDGFEGQIKYLCRGMGLDEAKEFLKGKLT